MNKLVRPWPLVMVLLIAILAAYGCSEKSSAPLTIAATEEVPPIEQYFPLSTGKVIDFSITNNQTEIESCDRYTVGSGLENRGEKSYIWIHTNPKYPSYVDTGYFYQLGNALYYLEDAEATPEKVLEAPFTVGRSWQRYQTRELVLGESDNLLETLINGGGGKNPDGAGDPDNPAAPEEEIPGDDSPFLAKNFPISGSTQMTITALEDIELDNGYVFENCIRVENGSASYRNNYWYAPEVGLVRYVLGINATSSPDGQVVGEIQQTQNSNGIF